MKLSPNIECLTAFVAALDDKLHCGVAPTASEAMQLRLLVSFVEWTSHQQEAAAKVDADLFKLLVARGKPQARQALARLERRLNGLRAFVLRAVRQSPAKMVPATLRKLQTTENLSIAL